MAGHEITDRIADLIDEEYRLRTAALHHGGLTPDERTRLKELERQLDAAVAMLHRRQALSVFDDD
ncbi:MAG TPA: DUF2630 family protein [Amycolatopsis sp.]|jgi:hypothetical protein|uniref:DUF2630 family protein n=1 Tax=Amycolatopsis nalaikhensis TaxID=715472 RepID=A0ABY8XG13_9PSEU|nr:DUF2630 family protein [Amycolatopsis sp. 2-2]WIV54546.1 DUF2630 family protein [Amycolatopsis sp. 2-2]